ncbi:MAG: hypothetical protein ACE5GF_02095 [Thermodesulfobacteriota bacterium]
MKIVGLDIGFGYTKVAAKDGFYRFPSVVGSDDGRRFQNLEKRGEGTVDETVCVDGERFLVGASAMKQSESIFSASEKEWIDSLTYRALLKYAYRSIDFQKGEDVLVVTGLPVNHYLQWRDGLAETVRSVADLIVAVEVLLQPMGSYFDCLMDDEAHIKDFDFMASRTGIMDIGYFTTDLVTMENIGFVKRLYSSHENGISTAYMRIVRDLYETYSLTKEPREIEKVIRDGFVKVSGERIDVKELIDKHLKVLNREIAAIAKNLWREGTNIDKIVITGGGAISLRKSLDFYRQIRFVDDSQYTNVRGYMKYGRMLQNGNV